jgi:hypothetical protein
MRDLVLREPGAHGEARLSAADLAEFFEGDDHFAATSIGIDNHRPPRSAHADRSTSCRSWLGTPH